MNMMLAVIPFAGFYCTWHDEELDRALESYFQDPETGDPLGRFVELAYFELDWAKVHFKYAEAYAAQFVERFQIEGVVFDELNSPREYNFTTDRIFVKIPQEQVETIRRRTDERHLRDVARQEFTSRSGFMSYYSNDFDEWGPLEEWDHNQVYALLRAYVRTELDGEDMDQAAEFELMEDYRCNGHLENWIAEAGNDKFKRLDKIYAYLRDRNDRRYKWHEPQNFGGAPEARA